jgi:hypothetical protein
MKENKLIAEFEQLPTEVFKSGIMNYYHDGAWYEEHELSYEKDWNWLIPVVEKIEDEGCGFEMNKQEEGDWQCLVIKGYDIIHQTFADCSREATHKAVVEFINQLNKES